MVLSDLEHECTVFQEAKLSVEIIRVFSQGWDLLYLQTKNPSCYCLLDTGKGHNGRLYYPWHSGQPEHQHINISSCCVKSCTWEYQEDAVSMVCLCCSWGTLSLGNWCFYRKQQESLLISQDDQLQKQPQEMAWVIGQSGPGSLDMTYEDIPVVQEVPEGLSSLCILQVR